ncbi:hypothetical protein BDV3_004739 [Batrachochytrium dendrobatidis]|nr:hypothetical protein O5D80_003219 [Batrachochytrium dendrobatidis]KAK5671128.1 hypothetical protein QVD99_002888 [Batrachochytrium dendrobatidis]
MVNNPSTHMAAWTRRWTLVACYCITLFAFVVHAQQSTIPSTPSGLLIPPTFKVGDCISGRLDLHKNSIIDLGGAEASRFTVDRNKYNFTLDYGQVDWSHQPNSASFVLTRPPPSSDPKAIAVGTRVSTTRYIRYGKITARFDPAENPGVVATFITFSDMHRMAPITKEFVQDEIDWETVGRNTLLPETNLFTYKALDVERGMHGGPIASPIQGTGAHEYTIDWKSDSVEWSIDGKVVRTQLRNQSFPVNPASLAKDEFWFPDSPSRIQLSVWDGSMTNREWAGGPIQWGSENTIKVPFEWVDIQCYDNHDHPVDRWSADGSGLPTAEAAIVVPPLSGNRRDGQSSTQGQSNSVTRGISGTLSHATIYIGAAILCLWSIGL